MKAEVSCSWKESSGWRCRWRRHATASGTAALTSMTRAYRPELQDQRDELDVARRREVLRLVLDRRLVERREVLPRERLAAARSSRGISARTTSLTSRGSSA